MNHQDWNCPCDTAGVIPVLLLEKIFSVRVDMYILGIQIPQTGTDSTPVTLSGMEKTVTQ